MGMSNGSRLPVQTSRAAMDDLFYSVATEMTNAPVVQHVPTGTASSPSPATMAAQATAGARALTATTTAVVGGALRVDRGHVFRALPTVDPIAPTPAARTVESKPAEIERQTPRPEGRPATAQDTRPGPTVSVEVPQVDQAYLARMEESLEQLRLGLIDLGHKISTSLHVANPIFQQFNCVCKQFHELKLELAQLNERSLRVIAASPTPSRLECRPPAVERISTGS